MEEVLHMHIYAYSRFSSNTDLACLKGVMKFNCDSSYAAKIGETHAAAILVPVLKPEMEILEVCAPSSCLY